MIGTAQREVVMLRDGVTIGDVYFPTRVLAAGGLIKNRRELGKVLFLPDGTRSRVGGIEIGSMLMPFRSGNEGDVYYSDRATCPPGRIRSFNSVGLSSESWDGHYAQELPEMVERAHALNLPVIGNIAAFDVPELITLAERVYDAGVDILLANISCGNTGGRVLAFAHDDFVKPAMIGVRKVIPKGKRVLYKLPYFPDRGMLEDTINFFNRFDEFGGVVGINTLANALPLDASGKPRITPFRGLSGMGGDALRELALGQCLMLLDCVRRDACVIGVGGILDYGHASLFLDHVGVPLIETHTAVREYGSKIFGELVGAAM